ncbi:MAG: hypothetical protein HY906_13495 [Deltaproteobacteria bacterium]|nr:hypothetical protein [Deltaproteobacteria bacterium]
MTYTMGTYSGSYSSVTTGRVRSVSVSRYPYGTWTDAISQVEWEPYGGLRGYQLAHATTSDKSAVEYYLGDSQATPGSSNCPAPSTNDGTGNVRALYVSRLGASETWAPGSGSGDILRRLVTWNADMPKRVDTCQLGATTAQREEYAHDSALRLTSASRPSGNFAATGGAYDSRTWSYDTRHNRVSEAADGVTYTLAYDAGVADRLASRYSTQSGTNLVNTWDSDADGRATSKWWPYCTGYGPCSASPAATPFRYLLKPGISGGGESSALESVYQTVSVGGATYSYFYDAHNRRRLKVYPSGVADEYFHSTDSAQLLADVGNLSLGGGGTRVLDEYVWLGGRPVASVRGLLSADWSGALVHGDDDAEGCGRNDDTETHCGLYFLVSDEGGRIVMALDSSRRVSGVGEYDAFGHVNRRLVDGETPHPYPNDAGLTLTAFTAHPLGPDGGVAWTVRANPHLFWSDGETSVDSNWNVTPHDKLRFLDGDGGQIPSGPGYAGEFWLFPNQPPRWTYWLPASTYGTLSVRFESDNQNCCLTAAPHGTWGDRDCNPSTCTCAPNCSYTGVTIDAWQYKKYEAGASPYFVPLRLPGQYHDEETDFFENWNRFYDPSRGAYTSPEPLVHATAFFKGAALAGTVAPTYTYASASPLAFFDVTGLGAIKPRGSASFVSAVTSYLGTEFGRLSSAEVSLAPFDVLITEGTHGRPAGRPDFGHTVPDDKHAMPTKIIITIDTAQVADFKAGKFKFDPYDPAHPHEVEELVAHELGHAIGIIRRTKGSSFGRGWWWSTVNHTDVEACGNGMGWREEKGLEPEDHQEVAKGDCPIAIIRDYKDKQAKRKRKTPPKPIPGPADQ